MNAHPLDAALFPPEPTRWSGLVFQFKARCFQARRLLRDSFHPVPKFLPADTLTDAPLIADWSSDLWHGGDSPRERELQLGKVQNLRIAARLLDGLEIPAGATWSFWRHLGRTTRAKGYATGRELREGCLIPQTGGGLCQLSGTLYNAALEAGLDIVERHAHSNSSIGSLARIGRDATVFWNYVDLRLRHTAPWRLEVKMDRDQLHVRIRSPQRLEKAPQPLTPPDPSAPPNACATCGIGTCHRSTPLDATHTVDRTAVLVDAWWPEWDTFFSQETGPPRDLRLPLDGRRWRKPSYQWDTTLHATTRTFPLLTLQRAWATRRLRNEGARRQRTLLQWDERLAAAYARSLQAHHSHLIISQNLLPYLWQDGWLGGRTFDVLMTRLPLHALHQRLDEAAALHPGSHTCADFRAPATLVEDETTALAAASRWITPHTHIARLAGPRAHLIPWSQPAAPPPSPQLPQPSPDPSFTPLRILFPASTLCRKGAYELRTALQDLPVSLELCGGILEGADFWGTIPHHTSSPGSSPLTSTSLVVLPAFVENCPRLLLQALAHRIPVIASDACGLPPQPGLTLIPAGAPAPLRAALLQHLPARTFS